MMSPFTDVSPQAVATLRSLAPDLVMRLRVVEAVIFDFDGVFTDNAVWVLDNGQEMVRCTRADGIGLSRLREIGIRTLVLSTEENPVVTARCRKLKIECIQGCPDKAAALPGIVAETLTTRLQQLAYVGNDINDAGALRLAGVPIVVADAHPDVISLAAWQTTIPGGHGAVREICELLYAARKATL